MSGYSNSTYSIGGAEPEEHVLGEVEVSEREITFKVVRTVHHVVCSCGYSTGWRASRGLVEKAADMHVNSKQQRKAKA